MEPSLNQRDLQILHGLGIGNSTKWIADDLKISAKTAEFHIAGLMKKLNAKSRVDLVLYAKEHGLAKYGERAGVIEKPKVKLDPLEVKNIEDLKSAILRGAGLAANNNADVVQTNALCQCSDAYIRVARFQLEHK